MKKFYLVAVDEEGNVWKRWKSNSVENLKRYYFRDVFDGDYMRLDYRNRYFVSNANSVLWWFDEEEKYVPISR